jgi:hypothetical protein
MKLVLLFVSVFAVQASAGVPFLSFAKKSHKIKNTLPCTDFTGKWAGMCTYTDLQGTGQYAAELNIQMSTCDSLVIHHNEYPVGGSKVESSSYKTGTSAMILNFDWNDKAKMEQINFSFSIKQVDFNNTEKNDVNGTGTLKISANKLNMVQKFSDTTVNCDYFKQ